MSAVVLKVAIYFVLVLLAVKPLGSFIKRAMNRERTLLDPDLEFILRDSTCKGIVVSTGSQLSKVLNIRSLIPELRFVFAMDRQTADPACEIGTSGSTRCW